MLGSPNDNECLNAINAIKGILSAQNKNFSDLSNHLFSGSARHEQPRHEQRQENKSWQDKYNSGFYNSKGRMAYTQEEVGNMLAELDEDHELSDWEEQFVTDIIAKRLAFRIVLSPKQMAALVRIYKGYTGKERP